MVVLLAAPWGVGQSTFGGIVGVVKDPSQGAVEGAQVKLTNLDEHTEREATADANGAFEFTNLKPGHYELLVHAPGFADYKVTALQLDARQSLRLDLTLRLRVPHKPSRSAAKPAQ